MKIVHIIAQQLTESIEGLVTLLLGLILVITNLLVFLRYGLNTGLTGGNELISYLFIYTTALGAAVSIGRNDHIRITYFINKLSGWKKRTVKIINLLLIAFINLVIIWLSFPWIEMTGQYESPVMRVPNWSIQICVPIGCGLVALFCFYRILSLIIDGNDEKLVTTSEP